MSIGKITMKQDFNAPLNQVFETLSDHATFGKICGINMTRVIDGSDGANGLGSVRKINIGLLPSFEETITDFIPNEYIQYKISKGSPIKNHVGELRFTEDGGKTTLNYTIELESKIPFTTGLIKAGLEKGISGGLRKYAKTL
jgi:uncharacterized membrane protein